MKRDSFDWVMMDTEGNVLVSRGYYTWDDVINFRKKYEIKGYVVHHQIAGIPNIMIMETADADDKRKKALITYILTLPIREQALLLAWLSKRVNQISLTEVWNNSSIRKVHDDLKEIRNYVWDFKDDIIATLRKRLNNID